MSRLAVIIFGLLILPLVLVLAAHEYIHSLIFGVPDK